MNKAQIKAELRRSAKYDSWPADDVSNEAYDTAKDYLHLGVDPYSPYELQELDCRTFFFLVSEAL